MAYEPKPGSFTLFKNDKGNNPKRPDWRGKVFIGGEEYKLSGWLRVSKDGAGVQYIKGSVERIDPNAAPYQPAAAPQNIPTPRITPPPTQYGLDQPTATEDVPF